MDIVEFSSFDPDRLKFTDIEELKLKCFVFRDEKTVDIKGCYDLALCDILSLTKSDFIEGLSETLAFTIQSLMEYRADVDPNEFWRRMQKEILKKDEKADPDDYWTPLYEWFETDSAFAIEDAIIGVDVRQAVLNDEEYEDGATQIRVLVPVTLDFEKLMKVALKSVEPEKNYEK